MKIRNGFVSNSSSSSFIISEQWQRDLEDQQMSDFRDMGRYSRSILKYLRKMNSKEQRKKWKEKQSKR